MTPSEGLLPPLGPRPPKGVDALLPACTIRVMKQCLFSHTPLSPPVGVESMMPSACTRVMKRPFSQTSMLVRKALGPRSRTSSFRTS